MAELAAEFPNLRSYCTLSPLPRFAEALRGAKPDRGEHTGRAARDGHEVHDEGGFTPERMSRLLADFAPALTAAAGRRDPTAAFFHLLEKPLAHREALAAPLERLALAYLTKAERDGKLYDPVATFHLSNGARLERINAFGNLRAYGIASSVGLTVNYRYLPEELEENHERFVRDGEIRVSNGLFKANKAVAAAWRAQPEPAARPRERTR